MTAIDWFFEKPSFSRRETNRTASKFGMLSGIGSGLRSDGRTPVENVACLRHPDL